MTYRNQEQLVTDVPNGDYYLAGQPVKVVGVKIYIFGNAAPDYKIIKVEEDGLTYNVKCHKLTGEKSGPDQKHTIIEATLVHR